MTPRLRVRRPGACRSPPFWASGDTVLRRWAGLFEAGWSDTLCYHCEEWEVDLMLAEDAVDMLLPSS